MVDWEKLSYEEWLRLALDEHCVSCGSKPGQECLAMGEDRKPYKYDNYAHSPRLALAKTFYKYKQAFDKNDSLSCGKNLNEQ